MLCAWYQPAHGQTPFQTEHLSLIEDYVLTKKLALAQLEIDQILADSLQDPMTKNAATAFQVEIMVEKEQYDKAIKNALECLEDKSFPPALKVRLWIQLGLIYEVLQQPQKSLDYLHQAQRYYISNPKDRYYGVFLYRKSSLHRVNDQPELALPLARKAREFGEKNGFFDVSGSAYFLLSSLHRETDSIIANKYLKKSMEHFSQMEDPNGVAAMLVNLAMVENNKYNFQEALRLTDSALQIAKSNKDQMTIESSYLAKSTIFEKRGDLDSALHYYKIYDDVGLQRVIQEQRSNIEKINTDYSLRQEILEREQAEKRLESAKAFNLYLWIFTGILVLVLSFLTWIGFRLKRKNNQISRQQNEIQTSHQELEAALVKKQSLLRELNHTVKNNLTLILSLVQFHVEELEDPMYRNKIEVLEKRIRAIALAHSQLTYTELVADGHFSDLSDYFHQIRLALGSLEQGRVHYHFNIQPLEVKIRTALPLGILINELISNSLKHAKTKNGELEIHLNLEKQNDHIEITYSDSGSTFTDEVDPGLGLFIINSMVEQLDGTLEQVDQTYLISFSIL